MKKHLTFVGCFLFVIRHVPCVHLGLEFGDFLICDGGGFAVVIVRVFEEHREEVFDGLAIAVPHRVHCSEDGFCDELVTEPAPSSVASDDAQHLPVSEVVEEVSAGDAYLTHKELIDFARRV